VQERGLQVFRFLPLGVFDGRHAGFKVALRSFDDRCVGSAVGLGPADWQGCRF